MTTTASKSDYFGDARPTIRSRVPSELVGAAPSPGSPRTPLLGRTISSQFGSPSAFRAEQEDFVVYELGSRHISAGFAGESRPRCILDFNPERDRRVGDYRACDTEYRRERRKVVIEDDWGRDFELFRTDLRTLDLGLVEDRLERAVRTIHIDHLQLDQKSRKAVLAVPSLLPTPLLEIALKVLFNHSPQPASVTILTTPLLACVAAGLRNALVVDIGWEEAVVTAVGEYKEILQRRSVRAGRMLTWEMGKVLREAVKGQRHANGASESDGTDDVDFEYAEDVTHRMTWCRSHQNSSAQPHVTETIKLPLSPTEPDNNIHIPFTHLSKPADTALFSQSSPTGHDDHDLPIHDLAYRVLLSLPLDLRTICLSRIIITGGISSLPGLKIRLLQELSQIVDTRGWDPVETYGSATNHRNRTLRERSVNANTSHSKDDEEISVPLSPAKKPIQESIPHSQRIHDDTHDPISRKAEREASKGKVETVKGIVRGVETLGAWAGASLIASLRVKGVHEVEKEDFLKNGFSEMALY